MNNFNGGKNNKEIGFIDWFRVLNKRKKLIFLFVVLFSLIGIFLSFILPNFYKAETFLEVQSLSGYLADGGLIYLSPDKIAEEIKRGFYGSYDIKTEAIQGTNIIRIESRAKSEKEALVILEDINNAVLEKYKKRAENHKKKLEKELEELKKRIEFLLSRGKEVEVLEAEIFKTKKEFVDQLVKVAKRPEIFSKIELSFKKGIFLGVLIGLIFSLVWISLLEWWNKNKLLIKEYNLKEKRYGENRGNSSL